jgi:hypothetical protein
VELVNKTPFVAERFAMHDLAGRDTLVIVVKCTYTIREGKPLEVAEVQVPIQLADECWGKPGESSVRYESDVVPRKTGTDVVMLGHAYAERGKAAEVDVSLAVGPLRRTIRVYGDRHWKKTMAGAHISPPEPFDRLALVYERAYGGMDLTASQPEQEVRNPVGRGFIARESKQNFDGLALPNLEDPARLIKRSSDRPAPVGFGFVGRHWQPRRALAGTYDDAWKANRAPLLPADFSEDYFNGAPAGLVSRPHLQGNESVRVINASRRSPLSFSLETARPALRMLMGEDPFSLEVTLDTLLIEPDLERVVMVWRGAQDVHHRLGQVEGIEVSILP